MFFVDKPYVSDFFKKTVRDNAIPVVDTLEAKEMDLFSGTTLISEENAIEMVRASENNVIYTTSENSIGWVSKHLSFTDLPEKIALFKNKVKFRELTKSLFPDFFFKEIRFENLKQIMIDEFPLPFIIKPSVGFFSMGVYKVSSPLEWANTIDSIIAEVDQIKDLYPGEVLDSSTFIIEQCIKGDEFAIDAYFNANGKPVILSILSHTFSSSADVSDRVYTSSKEIIESNLAEFTEFIGKIGDLAAIKNFPVHVELRRDQHGVLLPIEVNPLRFGGWCTTADLSFLAYGFNLYLYYFSQKEPDWSEVLKGKGGKLYCLIVLDNSTGKEVDQITAFDYKKLLSKFKKPLELRKIDFQKYPVFGFLFTETRADNVIELRNILDSDLNEFISTK